MQKISFSGHETFNCRPLWLKKGFDFVAEGRKFSEPDAVVHLGVGRNMVNSIGYWINSFGMLDENKKLSEFAEYFLGKDGTDPFLEDTAKFEITSLSSEAFLTNVPFKMINYL